MLKFLCFKGTCYSVQTFVLINLNSTAWFLMFNHSFCWKYQYNKYMFNFIDNSSLIHVSGCVGRVSSALLCPGAYDVVKTAQHMLSWIFIVLAHWNDIQRIDMSTHSDTLSLFRANQSLLFLLNAAYLAEKNKYQFYSLWFDLIGARTHVLSHSSRAH